MMLPQAPTQTGRDAYRRTVEQMTALLRALGAARYELVVVDYGVTAAPTQRRGPDPPTALLTQSRVRWLRGENARGKDIYLQPEGSSGVLLLDDLDSPALRRLWVDGLAPAAVVETSPGNYQAWVRVSPHPLPCELATALAKELARRYGGDPAAAGGRHPGRMPGFTNRKPARQAAGHHPRWALLRAAPGGVAPAGRALVEQLRHAISPPRAPSSAPQPGRGACVVGPADMSAQLRAEAQRFRVGWEADLRQRLSQFGSVDRSRLDYAWCLALCRTTTLPLADVTTVFRWGSPNVAEHRNPGDYAVRTVIKAAAQARSRPRHYPVTAGTSHVPSDERAD